MSVTKSISNTLLRILPLMDSSAATTGNGNEGNGGGVQSSVEIHDDNENGDATSLSSDSSCSSCVSSCPSFVNEREPLGPYRLVKTLGIGEFGKIKLGIHTETEQKVAIKVIKKNNDAATLAKVEREIQVLKSLRHPHIVKLIEVIETETRLGIILEYASGGELFEYVLSHSSLEEDIARNIFAQLISSVNHMHMKGIVHRDLKLENLLFLDAQQTHIIVSDFGFANSGANNKDLLSTCCGSPTYAAPELVYPSGGYKGPAADVWSCGVILYCMVCGYLPFDDDPENPESANLHQLYQYIRSTNTVSFPDFVSDDAQDLIRKMLQHDPAKRCTVDAIINHPWLQVYRSTLFDMSTEQLEQQALDSIKKHHIASSSASTAVDLHNQQQIHPNGHHRHHNQLSAIEENQQPQEEDEQQNDDELTAQPYKFLELNDHSDDNAPHHEDNNQTQTQQIYDINDQTQNNKDTVPTPSTDTEEQYRDAVEPDMDYKPLELTQVSNSTEQNHQQHPNPVQNDKLGNVTSLDNKLDQEEPAQTKNDDQTVASESPEVKTTHQQAFELAQEDRSVQKIETQLSATPDNEQQLNQRATGLDEQPQSSNELKGQQQTTNGLEELPRTEDELEKLPPVEDQHHAVNQEHQEQVQNIQNPPTLTKNDQHQELNQCSTQGETGLAQHSEHYLVSSQPDKGDQKLDGQETHDHEENVDATSSQHQQPEQHEMEQQKHNDVEEKVEAMQIYSEQPPQHPMDTQPPITTTPADNEAKTPSAAQTNDDKDLSFLPSLPSIPNPEVTLHDSGIKEQQRQRQPSLRRQKKFRPSIADDEPLPINTAATVTNTNATNNATNATNANNTIDTTTVTNTNADNNAANATNIDTASNTTTTNAPTDTSIAKNIVKTVDQSNQDEYSKGFIGIRRSLLLGENDNTQYYSAVKQNDTIASDQTNNHISDSDDNNEINNTHSKGKVQNLPSASLPILNHSSNTMGTAIHANTSTTNLNDAIKKYQNGASLPTSPTKQQKRISSILPFNHSGPRPQRSQSTHLPKKSDYKVQGKEKESSSPTTTTSSTKLPVARKRTMTQTVKAWIHNKKKPFSKHQHHHHHHRPSTSSLSESSSSGEFDGHEHSPVEAQQQQQQQQQRDEEDIDQQRRKRQQKQIQQYRTSSSSPSSSVETPTMDPPSGNMRTLPHAQGENLTSMAPGNLILALVRTLTALGIDVKHDSSYQLTCLRKSCHHHKHSFNKKRNSKPFTVLTAPIYGPPELDHGHHVEFSVEICLSLLPDLHVIDIQLTDGDALAFQFLRSKLLSLLNLNA